MKQNPRIEICALLGESWLRIAADAVEDDDREARVHMLDAYPSLKALYAPDDGNTQVFYLKNVEATFSSFTAAPKTIYGWESGQANPSADILLTLCDLYNITDILEAFGYDSNENFHVTPSERTIIEAYRAHPEMHEAVSVLLGCSVPRKGSVSAHNTAAKEVSHPKQHSSGTNTTAAPKPSIKRY